MTIEHRQIQIEGRVQGVGFRPFVYRLAQEKSLQGWVLNTGGGVEIDVQGDTSAVDSFLQQLQIHKPLLAEINRLCSQSAVLLEHLTGFEIKESTDLKSDGLYYSSQVDISPDLAPCDACLRDMFDPLNRRYHYPFTHCTDCGPRFSMINALPYDRANTTLEAFPLCPQCLVEYRDPLDRRFHAEAIACPTCGPQLQLLDRYGHSLAGADSAIEQAAQVILDGNIVAVKGVGGFQLFADASNSDAITTLRQRKHRPAKPFALLFPDLEYVQQHCELSVLEKSCLQSAQRPIVLLAKKNAVPATRIAAEVAPGVSCWGAMLPCSPLHYLLMTRLGRAVVATSGNTAGEPICINDEQALDQFGAIADLLLTHNRPIARPVDDAVIRVIDNRACMIRLGRGYAPLSLPLPSFTLNDENPPPSLLAVGGHLKNTLALFDSGRVHLSQHIGDLESRHTQLAFEQVIGDLCRFHRVEPDIIVHDQHPGYASTQWAQSQAKTRIGVQHHVAHFFSCMAEHGYRGPALGISWDGTGYSDDGVIRGGECFYWDGAQAITPVARLLTFPLPGGEQAIREPRRQGAALLYSVLGEAAFTCCPTLWQQFTASERYNLQIMLQRGLNTPPCSSIGRLFDGVAALLGLASRSQFEGQAAMALEDCAQSSSVQWHLPFAVYDNGSSSADCIIDWQPMILKLLALMDKATPRADLAAAFHNTLARIIVEVSKKAENCPLFLSGGVFQNKRLTETTTALLRPYREVFCHQKVPPNDGGLCLGQIYFSQHTEGVR